MNWKFVHQYWPVLWPTLVGWLVRMAIVLGGGLLFYRGISRIARLPGWRGRLVGFALVALGGQLCVIGIGSHYDDAHSSTPSCYANLKQIQGAKATWALENSKAATDEPTVNDLSGPEKYIRDWPACALGGVYTLGKLNVPATCTAHPVKVERGVALVRGSRRTTLRLELGWWRYEIDRPEWRPL